MSEVNSNIIKSCYHLLSVGQSYKALLSIVLLILASIAEVFGVAAILPLVDLFLNPSSADKNIIVLVLQDFRPSVDPSVLSFWAMLILSSLILSSFVFRACGAYLMLRFALSREHYISSLLIKNFLWKKYPWYFNQNKSDLKKITISEVNAVVNSGLLSFLTLLTQITVSISIFSVLLVVNATVSIIAISVCALCYFILYFFMRQPLLTYGKQRLSSNETRFKILDSALSYPKVIQANRLESTLHKNFGDAAWRYAHSQIVVQIIKLLPRYILEFIAFLVLLSFLIVNFSTQVPVNDILPSLALFVFAGYRVLPSAQQIYASKAQLDASAPAIIQVMTYFYDTSSERVIVSKRLPLYPLKNSITFDQVDYVYPGQLDNCIDRLSIEIKKGEFLGIMGKSGSGKTTFLDLFMGLLEPTHGQIIIDDQVLDENLQFSWLKQLSYVTQEVVLFDQSLVKNITMLDSVENVVRKDLKIAWYIACIDDFANIDQSLESNESIGDEGIKLSGGQRQRIALARAIYQKPAVLILDEATSSLDKEIQSKVIQRLIEFRGNMTVLMVGHDPDIFSYCDRIINLPALNGLENKKSVL